jgi:hypothetical protein
MQQNGLPPMPPGLENFDANRSRFPPEQLLPFRGQHIAWSADGTRILACGDDMLDVERKLVAAGIDPSQIVHDYVDHPDTVLF